MSPGSEAGNAGYTALLGPARRPCAAHAAACGSTLFTVTYGGLTVAATRLNVLLEAGEFIVAPGVFDMVSAKLADRLGFKALYMTGYGDRKSTRLNSSHAVRSRMPSSA